MYVLAYRSNILVDKSGLLFKPIYNFINLIQSSGRHRFYCDLQQKVNESHYRPEVPRGFQEVKVPRLRDSGPEWW